eukprot:c25165_g3_i2 orf=187-2037(+)
MAEASMELLLPLTGRSIFSSCCRLLPLLFFMASSTLLLCTHSKTVNAGSLLEGQILMELKNSLKDTNNELDNWDDTSATDQHCYWRGITCDNVTLRVTGLNLSSLKFSGEISPAIGKLRSLVTVDLSYNMISGQIPDEIGDCSSLQYLDLSFNEIDGDIPFSLSKLKNLQYFKATSNHLKGLIPSTLSQLPNLQELDLGDNSLFGEIPNLLFWSETMRRLVLRNNFLKGTLSPDICRMSNLEVFDVSNNNLTGEIPENIGNCTSIQVLLLGFNQLTGEIPYNVGFLQVSTLSLQGNRLSGSIPEVLGLMQALVILDLSNNQLRGTIPAILGNLSYTAKLYLEDNYLSGPIPPELGNMTSLQYLDLSYNHLSGSIPYEFGQLQDLHTLFLNNNNLSGSIPQQLSNCLSLIALNLSYNNLSGEIPTMRNFTRFSIESYRGNKGLCGNRIGVPCGPTYPHPSNGPKSKNIFIGLGLSAAICVLGLLAWLWKSNQQHINFGLKETGKSTQGLPRIVILHMDLAGHGFDDIMRLTENLSQRYVIGFGASSTVYKCILKSGKPVAVKKLFNHYQQNNREFEAELDTVGRIKHRNLVSLLGYSLSPHGNLLFYDYMENGSLWD